MKNILIVLYVFLLFVSCKNRITQSFSESGEQNFTSEELLQRCQTELTQSEYLTWVNNKENGLSRSRKMDNISYSLTYRPSAYIISQEFENKPVTAEQYKLLMKELDGMKYFMLELKVDNYEDEFIKYKLYSGDHYQQRVEYCSFEMQQDLKLVAGDDSIDCDLFHFERTFSITPYGRFLLGFNTPPHAQTYTLVFRDRLFNNGIIKYSFREELLNSVPKLKTI